MPRLQKRSVPLLGLSGCLLQMVTARADLILSNPALELRLDEGTGSIRQIHLVATGLDLITHPDGQPPFSIATSAGTASATGFQATLAPGGRAYDLHWETTISGVSFDAEISLPTASDAVGFRFRLTNQRADVAILSIEYPIAAGIQRLQPVAGTDSELLSAAQGYLFQNPSSNLPIDQGRWFYPDGYGGASTQLWGYFRQGVGGFALEARDAGGLAKRFDFYREPANGDIRWSLLTMAPDESPGLSFDPQYEVQIVALSRGDWEAAAEHYRAWALLQPWSERGRVADRSEGQFPRWLYEATYAVSFGISINLDQSRWFKALHDWVGGPLFHISGFWWPGGTAASEWYGGYNDWSDARVNPANLTAISSKGDRWAPFLFDLHFSRDGNEWLHPAPNPSSDPVAPWSPYEMTPDPESAPWAYICPATSTWPAFHGWRNLQLWDNYHYDANYYDIGAGLGRVRCTDGSHGHPPGQGRWMIDAYRSMLGARRDELHARAGHYVAAGTELISELYLREFDYYQARAEGSVMSMLEGDQFRGGEKAGWKSKIPLFTFLYHDLGPVRVDGNLKAASQFGEIFYWIAGRTVAWGGLPEMNYELSALEKFPGMTDLFTWYETYKSSYQVIDNSPYPSSAARGQYLGRLGAARTGFAKPYLAYGSMTRSPRVIAGIPTQSVDWHLYNTFNRNTDTSSGIEHGDEFFEQGNLTIDPLLTSGWSDSGRSIGLFLLNVTTQPQNVTIETDPARHGVPFLNYMRSRLEQSGSSDLGVVSGAQSLALSLASRVPIVIRLQPAPCSAPSCLYRVYRDVTASPVASLSAPFEIAPGHQWDEPAPLDGVTRFYLVDDGGGFPATLTVRKLGSTVRLSW